MAFKIAIDGDTIYDTEAMVAVVFPEHGLAWWYRNRAKLEADGFPPPQSRVGHPRWLGRRLKAWLEREPAAPAAAENLVDHTELLRRRARQLAGSRR